MTQAGPPVRRWAWRLATLVYALVCAAVGAAAILPDAPQSRWFYWFVVLTAPVGVIFWVLGVTVLVIIRGPGDMTLPGRLVVLPVWLTLTYLQMYVFHSARRKRPVPVADRPAWPTADQQSRHSTATFPD